MLTLLKTKAVDSVGRIGFTNKTSETYVVSVVETKLGIPSKFYLSPGKKVVKSIAPGAKNASVALYNTKLSKVELTYVHGLGDMMTLTNQVPEPVKTEAPKRTRKAKKVKKVKIEDN